MKSGLLLDVVIRKGSAILELLAGKDKTLLIRRDAFLVLNFSLDVVDSIRRLYFKSDSLASEGFDEDLHCEKLSTVGGVQRKWLEGWVERTVRVRDRD